MSAVLQWALDRVLAYFATPDPGPVRITIVPDPPAPAPERCGRWTCWCRSAIPVEHSGPYMRWAPGMPVLRFLPDPAVLPAPARAA